MGRGALRGPHTLGGGQSAQQAPGCPRRARAPLAASGKWSVRKPPPLSRSKMPARPGGPAGGAAWRRRGALPRRTCGATALFRVPMPRRVHAPSQLPHPPARAQRTRVAPLVAGQGPQVADLHAQQVPRARGHAVLVHHLPSSGGGSSTGEGRCPARGAPLPALQASRRAARPAGSPPPRPRARPRNRPRAHPDGARQPVDDAQVNALHVTRVIVVCLCLCERAGWRSQ